MDYDFNQLNDKEFEALTIDLLSYHLNTHVEKFKSGKDGGIDGRFYIDPDKEVIIQCKHYIKTGFRGLISKLKNEEKEKVIKLNPNKYILVTSIELSPQNKKEIKEIFSPYIKCDNDIFGREDLNCILSKHSEVENKYYKLWISSTTVLLRLLNNAIKGRSEYKIEEIISKSNKYIETESHVRAIEHLNNNNVVIITGEPGIGKTTLAENICLQYVINDFEFILIEESLSEAESVYQRNRKQIFYFDDFLGSSYFEAIENKKDSHIINFISRIKNDKSKIFILTSRSNIVNSGIVYSPIFKNNKLDNNYLILNVNNLSKMDKARILYNHIWFSNLSNEYIDILYTDKNYRKIIDHKNYNPRLISFITDTNRIKTNSEEYWEYIQKQLDNPADIWEDNFNIQNNIYVRCLVYLTVFNGATIEEENLKFGYLRICKAKKIANSITINFDFKTITKISVGSFLNRTINNKSINYTVYNPSISDYILQTIKGNIEEIKDIYFSLRTTKSIETLYSLKINNYFSKEKYLEILISVLDTVNIISDKIDFILLGLYHYYLDSNDIVKYRGLLNDIISHPREVNETRSLLYLLYFCSEEIDDFQPNSLVGFIQNKILTEDEIELLTDVYKEQNIEDEDLLEYRHVKLTTYLENKADDVYSEVDASEYVRAYEDGYTDIDRTGLERAVEQYVEKLFNEVYDDAFDKGFDPINDILINIDTDSMIDAEKEAVTYYQKPDKRIDLEIDDIDELFERT